MPELSLGQKQKLFTKLVARLIEHIYESGYEATLGEAWRPAQTAAYYADKGKGIKNSNHIIRLAIDINLFKDGKYLTDTASYKWLGDWWKVQNSLCAWGGDFTRADGNHFSLEHAGVK